MTNYANGDKLSPYIMFKSKNSKLLNKLKANKNIMNKKFFVNINNYAWSNTEIINDWFNKVYFPYINKDPLLGNKILIMDKASRIIEDNKIEKSIGNFCEVSILPAGCTNIL